jgi:outer membrane protein OmpA-like peptidoglycan-associated protein
MARVLLVLAGAAAKAGWRSVGPGSLREREERLGMSKWIVCGVIVGAGVAGGCGPTVFEGRRSLAIVGNLPPSESSKPKPDEHAKVVGDHIVIDEKIQFAYDSAVILSVSHGILDAVVKVMVENPAIERVRVEGHASDEGHGAASDAYNKQLSDRRARSVMDYLVSRGIDRRRLEAAGYGVEQPIADNSSEEGRERNRRVEFEILAFAKAAD